MTEPVTTNRTLIVPNTGDLPGAWGTAALNPNFQTIDAMFGGVTTISLSGATTLLLSVPATTGVWPGSLSQSVNSLIKFTGAQSGNAIIQFTLPGYYIVQNQCTGTSYVQLAPSAGVGNSIGAPPGKKCHVFYDGTDMDYVNMPDPGTAYDLHTNTTSLPPWMLACTVKPYILKDGSTYTSSVYPALAQLLGSTFGGNGITTFGVPDERSRFRLAVDTGATGRVTTAGSGINGQALGTSGGAQTQTLTLAQLPTGITVTGTVSPIGRLYVPGTNGPVSPQPSPSTGGNYVPYSGSGGADWASVSSFGGSMTSNNTGASAHPIMPPAIVSFLPLVKT